MSEPTAGDGAQGVLVPFPKPLNEMTPAERRAMARTIFEQISAILPPKPSDRSDTDREGSS